MMLDGMLRRGRGRREDAALALFAEGLWVREDSLRELLTGVVRNVRYVLDAVPVERVPEGFEQDEGWERAHSLTRYVLQRRDRLFRRLGTRLRAHARSRGSNVTGTDLADSALTAMFASALGSPSALDDEVLDAIAIGFGLCEPGEEVSLTDREAVESALGAKSVPVDLVQLAQTASYRELLERRDRLREIQQFLTQHLSDPEVPHAAIATLLECLAQPPAFTFLCLQSLAAHPPP